MRAHGKGSDGSEKRGGAKKKGVRRAAQAPPCIRYCINKSKRCLVMQDHVAEIWLTSNMNERNGYLDRLNISYGPCK